MKNQKILNNKKFKLTGVSGIGNLFCYNIV